MNVIIAGAGKFGSLLTKHLAQEKHDVIVIDKNPNVINELVNEYDVKGFCGNGANYDTLIDAECQKADLFIAATSGDEVNIFSCLVAKKLGAKQTIARVRNPEYAKQVLLMNKELGISMTVNPEYDTAKEISRILRFPSALKVETFANGKVDLVEIKLDYKSPLIDNTLSSIHAKHKVTVLVCAVKRGDKVYIPNGDFVLEAGDNVYITADSKEIVKLFRRLNILKERSKRIMIVGGGRITHYLAKELSETNTYTKIIDVDLNRCKDLSEKYEDITVINGDATNQRLLLEEGLPSMDALVSLTGMDETNIIISTFANAYNIDKVITKVNNSSYNMILDRIGLECIVSPKEISSNNIIRYVRGIESGRGSEFKTLYRFVDNKVEAIEFFIPSKTEYTSIPIKDLHFKDNVLLACINRQNDVIIPQGKDTIEPLDNIIIFTTNSLIKDAKDIFK